MIAIIDYRAGNVMSVKKAFDFLGSESVVTSSPRDVADADKLVLPGVGHFAATATLDDLILREPILTKIGRGVPFLGICVGMQWLFAGSTEAPGYSGLGLFSGSCSRFSPSVKSPHVGWNTFARRRASRLLRDIPETAYAYFTHSYRAPVVDACVATTDYDGEFTSVVERDNVFGVQFHPEKSSDVGLRILKNFIELPAC